MEVDPNQEGGLWDFIFNGHVLPELKARINRGELPSPYKLENLNMFQVLFYPDGKREVRLNTEVKGVGRFGSQITAVSEITLTGKDANCGHVTFFQLDDRWSGSFDFRHYQGKSRHALTVAREYVAVAEHCRTEKKWSVFLDNLWAAAELAGKAHLFQHSKDVVKTKKHGLVLAEFNKQRKIGNIDPEHAETFNKLSAMRDKARYAEDSVTVDDATADRFLADVKGLIEKVHSSVKGALNDAGQKAN